MATMTEPQLKALVQYRTEDGLAILVGDDVADPGDGQRDDGGSAAARQEAREAQGDEARHERTGGRPEPYPEGACDDDEDLAARVSQRPQQDLGDAI